MNLIERATIIDFTGTVSRAAAATRWYALGYRSADPHVVNTAFGRMYAAADRALIFNVFDAQHFPEHPLLVGRDLVAIEAFCRRLALNVQVVHGYADDDAPS